MAQHLPFRVLLFLMMLCTFTAPAQNLVPNGDFEKYSKCPEGVDEIVYDPAYRSFPYVPDWVSAVRTAGNYFRACQNINPLFSTPSNIWGYQRPHSGLAYAALVSLAQSGRPTELTRIAITTKLNSPLIKDSIYRVAFFASNTHYDPGFGFGPLVLNEIGANLSDTMPYTASHYGITLPYSIANDSLRQLTDTAVWYEIAGAYKAKGGEQWMTIGCLSAKLYPSTTPTTGYPGPLRDCITYIDDASVIKLTRRRTIYHTVSCDSMIGGNVVLTASLVAANYGWSTGDTTRSIRVSRPGTYVCTAYSNSEYLVDSFYLGQQQIDTIHNIVVCNPANAHTTLSSSATGATYSWSTGDTSRRITIDSSGAYTCIATTPCRITRDIFQVKIGFAAPPLPYDTTICRYVSAPVLAIRDTGILWFGSGISPSGSAAQPLINTAVAGQQLFRIARRQGACTSSSVPVTVTIKGGPEAHPVDTLLRCDGTVNYLQTIGTQLTPDVQYSWTGGDISCCIVPVADGLYIRTASNDCGTAADTFSVRSEACDRCVQFPAAFTPNGDGRNDGFGALLRCPVKRFYLYIYNRWGERVFNTDDQAARWNGTQRGIPAPAGTYMFEAEMFHATTGKKIFVKGEVILIR